MTNTPKTDSRLRYYVAPECAAYGARVYIEFFDGKTKLRDDANLYKAIAEDSTWDCHDLIGKNFVRFETRGIQSLTSIRYTLLQAGYVEIEDPSFLIWD